MNSKDPSFLKIIRAPFLSSIYAPLLIGTLAAVFISGGFSIPGFVFVLIMGTGLQIATSVYNDIFDTIQGADSANVHRNEFSGGSGILLERPHLVAKFYSIGRWSLIVALLATIALTFVVKKDLWPHLWGLFLLSAFFAKFYTASPPKLAYRGCGEISVWLSYGPMAILVAAVSQNVAFSPLIIALIPATGLSTLSILLMGQLIDLEGDVSAGKLGVAARLGTNTTKWIFFFVHTLLVLNVVLLAWLVTEKGWPLLLGIVPYLFLFPKILKIVFPFHDNPQQLKRAARYNVLLHLLFSILLIAGWAIVLFLKNG